MVPCSKIIKPIYIRAIDSYYTHLKKELYLFAFDTNGIIG